MRYLIASLKIMTAAGVLAGLYSLAVASGISTGTGGAVASSGSVTTGDLASWSGGSLSDSGIPSANVVLVSRAVQAGTGLTVTNSGLLTADITMSLTRPVTVANGGIGATTAVTGFTNLSPQTTKGDIVAYSTLPIRLAVGATGTMLTADSTQATGLLWSTEHTGTATGGTAAAGYVGETLRLTRVQSAAIGLSSATTCNVGAATCPSTGGTQSITLTPGDWSCQSMVGFTTGSATSVTAMRNCISATSATLPAADTTAVPTTGEACSQVSQAADVTSAGEVVLSIPPYQVTVTAGATKVLYLVARASFTVSTLTTYGSLECRRMR